jgi:uracil-DNA glycosylase
MHADAPEGGRPVPSKEASGSNAARGEPGAPGVPTTDDEIQEKYLERAIRELNQLTHRLQDCSHCPRGNLMPVLGSGHPQADIFLLKFAPTAAEVEEGVAFYGRSGNALMKSFKRLGIDPLVVYGTLCVKCPVSDPALAAGECIERVVEELAIVQPRCVVVMGARALETLNELGVPLARELEPRLGEIQPLTPTIEALYVPDIDDSLDSEGAKREFWSAFRALGDWYADLPPY